MHKNESEKLKTLIIELESERDSYHAALEESRTALFFAREEFQRSNRTLLEENTQLKKSLAEVGASISFSSFIVQTPQAEQKYEIELDHQQQRLKASESSKGLILLDRTLTEQSVSFIM